MRRPLLFRICSSIYGLCLFRMILFFEFELAVVVEVHVFKTILGILFDRLVILFW